MASLTLKNLPDELYAALKSAAERNRRSLNGEAILRLERSLGTRTDPAELLTRIRHLREQAGPLNLSEEEIRASIRRGRL